MRILLLMRGVPGSGKSTFIKEQGLKPYTLSAYVLRLLYASPMLDNAGRWCISPHFDKQMWPFLPADAGGAHEAWLLYGRGCHQHPRQRYNCVQKACQ
ncbi:hypothetical protein HMPREF9443_00107 [Phascolarctobacterium succinatutens YIT 12067]|uniref:Uncharacterized protein n=1 Tax=Phascolarctobacterium succinatutens YIT 12067 TaxID=626939 RepID=E8LB98_9FIRM|nr:hypothetical protein [Phascolarctobacterium succinatutens]EFY05899.1 hypothetical protein HMPREF9443_00107 [Phascolarctobacterium succinatutens YIT 12067]